jgi:hypothetical protein
MSAKARAMFTGGARAAVSSTRNATQIFSSRSSSLSASICTHLKVTRKQMDMGAHKDHQTANDDIRPHTRLYLVGSYEPERCALRTTLGGVTEYPHLVMIEELAWSTWVRVRSTSPDACPAVEGDHGELVCGCEGRTVAVSRSWRGCASVRRGYGHGGFWCLCLAVARTPSSCRLVLQPRTSVTKTVTSLLRALSEVLPVLIDTTKVQFKPLIIESF